MTSSYKVVCFLSIGILLVALIFNHIDNILVRHFFFLISLGKIPGFKILSKECISEKKLHPFVPSPCLEHGHFSRVNVGHNETLFREILSQAMTKRCPVVIEKPFRDNKCFERLKVLGQDPSYQVRYKDNYDWLYSHRDLWFEVDSVENVANLTADITTLGSILKELSEQEHSRKHLSFDRSLIGSYGDIWGYDLSWIGGVSASNFMSNYNETIVTSPFHSAMFDSFGYQCVGSKTWRFLQPSDNVATMEFFGTGFSISQDCNNREDVIARTIEETIDADTMLYFPPFWGHGVRTTKGLSILLNYRKIDMLSIAKRDGFMLALHTLASTVLHVTLFVGRDGSEIRYFYEKGEFPDIKRGLRQASWGQVLGRSRKMLGL